MFENHQYWWRNMTNLSKQLPLKIKEKPHGWQTTRVKGDNKLSRTSSFKQWVTLKYVASTSYPMEWVGSIPQLPRIQPPYRLWLVGNNKSRGKIIATISNGRAILGITATIQFRVKNYKLSYCTPPSELIFC